MKALKRKQKREREGELYAKIEGKFIPLSGIAIGPSVKGIVTKPVEYCIDKYLKNYTAKKCPKNIKNEARYFSKLQEFCTKNNIKNIDKITQSHIEEIETEFLKIMKPSSLNRRFSVYRHFFNKCDEWGHLTQNPFTKIKRKKIVKVHFQPWTKKEFDSFIKKTDGTWKKIFVFLWLTGCRPMELKNLKWTDIDYDNKCIKFECYKNKDGKRAFPLTPLVDKLLHSLKVDSHFVFSIGKEQISNDTLYQYAKWRLKALGYTNLTVYGLRHSFACGLNSENVNAFKIQHLLGHSDIRTTLNYIHPNSDDLTDALKKAKR